MTARSMNISWWVKRWSELYPARPAIFFEDREISYLELNRRVDETTCWLQCMGIRRGDRAALMLGNYPEFLELYLACARAGVIFVPINCRLAADELRYALENCKPRLFVFGEEFLETVRAAKTGYGRLHFIFSYGRAADTSEFPDYSAALADYRGRKPTFQEFSGSEDPGEPEVIMFTSGTTGRPKGAVLSHRKTFFNCLNADLFFNLSTDDVFLIFLPLFHSGGLFIQAAPTIYKGATILIHPRFDAEKAYQDIERFRVTKLVGVPTVYRALLQVQPEKRRDISSLKFCGIGGEKVTPDLLFRCSDAGLPVCQIMGQTETSIMLWSTVEMTLQKPLSQGRPVFHSEIVLVDNDGQLVKSGEVGEMLVRGPIILNEYWRDPVRTGQALKDGWLHTGDLARMDEEGLFYLVDRAKDMYISGGENVYPAEIERTLREHPLVEDVAVVGMEDEKWGEVGHAFVICKDGRHLDFQKLVSFCQGRLARYKWPKAMTVCDDFPRTALGKVRKGQLAMRLRR